MNPNSLQTTEVAVIGAGPGGYVAALRLADLGKKVLLIEERSRLGGTCLLEGCIPSKSLIHAVEICHEAQNARKIGLEFNSPSLNIQSLREWKDSLVSTLAGGIDKLTKLRKIEVIHGQARFLSNRSLIIENNDLTRQVDFQYCIIATGSQINQLPAAYCSPAWSSAEALTLPYIPQRLLVIGGGYIGLEMGLVYAGLGAKVAIADLYPRLLLGADSDLVNIMLRHVETRLEKIMVESKVVQVQHQDNIFKVNLEHKGETLTQEYDQVLVAVGRHPNTRRLGLENTQIQQDERGFIQVDAQCRTREPHIFAIGDVVPGPMLAHKASREGKVVAEVIAGHPATFHNRAIPEAVFTDPEIAWTGLTEGEAQEQKIPVNIGRFPLSALGRAWTLGRTEGMVKIISEPKDHRVLGIGMVGPHASELIAEGTLVLEMGAKLEDLMVTIHPHPTISEAIMEAAEMAAGTPIHISPRRKRH